MSGSDIVKNWQPQRATLDYGDMPFQISYNGTTAWAVAPNRPRTEVPTSNGEYTGFANTWNQPAELGAHENAGSIEPVKDLQDLVFNVPLPTIPTIGAVQGVYGLALVSYAAGAPKVTAYAPIGDWQHQVVASSF
ncbi:hypothetical protein RHODO2019_18155 (plasmid) [Rhodococcus antarcticus]|uniref:Uncharacterized protein n=1 Tax=Rhodococcus antarcticus TaxID=2987751 RepID=A0ABY6P5I4_9NOCA|nr:hypothetical protein [Rhodococcus antarcticus]UZJ26917.1 hypothetical protein RHODO2019_18155 [Rhodococcus antarcticus]